MPDEQELKSRDRSHYGFFADYRTRWNDNDMYGHVNNSIYNLMIDSIVNYWLINVAGQKPMSSPQRGLVVRSTVNYFASMAYPAVAELGLRVAKMGKSSVEYEIGVFEVGEPRVKAVGHLVHVFIDVETGRPSPTGLSDALRQNLTELSETPACSALERKAKL